MILSKTPLRISFVGGGTDLPDFYEEHGGAVVSTGIDKWIHVLVARRFEGDIRVSYSTTEIVSSAGEVQHELVRECLRLTGIPRGVDIATFADVPSRGTGLGSSSAVTVGLLGALYAFQGVYRDPSTLADEAARIEIEVLGKPIGKQDQYAAAVGGLNLIEFRPRGGGVHVHPVVVSPSTLATVHRSSLMFYLGRQRSAAGILDGQARATRAGQTVGALKKMRDLAYELHGRLAEGDADALGQLLHKNWLLKRDLAVGVSDDAIDDLLQRALDAGATGGKVLGAGGGGFLLIVAPPAGHARVRAALADLREVPFRFAARGTHIVHYEARQ